MRALLIANWKMNPATYRDAKDLFEATKSALDKASGVSVIIAPPALYLRELRASYKGKRISFAAQNAHFSAGGAFTGDISMQQVQDAKASHVLIGHAERRAAGESNDDMKRKVAAAFAAQLTPILCVGERTRTHSGEHFDFIREQLRVGLSEVPAGKIAKVIVAYEPVWAIGASAAMKPTDMHEMAIFIRKMIVEQHGEGGHDVKILYGGSIDESNVADMLLHGDVDGLLVGRASADADKMTLLLEAIGAAK